MANGELHCATAETVHRTLCQLVGQQVRWELGGEKVDLGSVF